MEARLRSKLFIQALLRRCDIEGTPGYVVHSGDADAGAIIVKLAHRDRTATVLTPVRREDGERAWTRGTGPAPVADMDAEAYIARQRTYDADLWVIEIEDRDGRHPLADNVS